VPEENFWTLWCKGRLTEADTLTIRLGATLSGLTSAHLHHTPIFFYGPDALPAPNQQCQGTEGNSSNSNEEKSCRMLTAGLSGPSVFSRMARASLRSDAASLYLPWSLQTHLTAGDIINSRSNGSSRIIQTLHGLSYYLPSLYSHYILQSALAGSPALPVKKWRFLLEQSFTACTSLLMVTSAFGLAIRP